MKRSVTSWFGLLTSCFACGFLRVGIIGRFFKNTAWGQLSHFCIVFANVGRLMGQLILLVLLRGTASGLSKDIQQKSVCFCHAL